MGFIHKSTFLIIMQNECQEICANAFAREKGQGVQMEKAALFQNLPQLRQYPMNIELKCAVIQMTHYLPFIQALPMWPIARRWPQKRHRRQSSARDEMGKEVEKSQ